MTDPIAPLAFDTNVLVYAEGVERAAADGVKCATALRLFTAFETGTIVLARQALAELHSVLVRKDGRSALQAGRLVRGWAERSRVIDTDATVFQTALGLAADHGLQIFDAIILAAAVAARCDLLLSEDFQDGFTWRGVVVTNPFGPTPDRRIERLLT